jgi:hypothetical protein
MQNIWALNQSIFNMELGLSSTSQKYDGLFFRSIIEIAGYFLYPQTSVEESRHSSRQSLPVSEW